MLVVDFVEYESIVYVKHERIFFQNNTNIKTILLVSIVFKLFNKLISRELETRDHCSKSRITGLISMKFA